MNCLDFSNSVEIAPGKELGVAALKDANGFQIYPWGFYLDSLENWEQFISVSNLPWWCPLSLNWRNGLELFQGKRSGLDEADLELEAPVGLVFF